MSSRPEFLRHTKRNQKEVVGEAIRILEEVGNDAAAAPILLEFGRAFVNNGNLSSAQQLLILAEIKFRKIGYKPYLVDCFLGQGELFINLGSFIEAINSFEAALKEIAKDESLQIAVRRGQSHYGLATSFKLAGNAKNAGIHFEAALKIFKEVEDRTKPIQASKQSIPAPPLLLGAQSPLTEEEWALSIAKGGIIDALAGLGKHNNDLGFFQQDSALERRGRLQLEEAVKLSEELTGYPNMVALFYLAGSYREDPKQSIRFLLRVLEDSELWPASYKSATLNWLMAAFAADGHPDIAIALGKLAVGIENAARSALHQIDVKHQKSYQTGRPLFRDLVSLLMAAKRTSEALEVIHGSRDQEFFDQSDNSDSRPERLYQNRIERSFGMKLNLLLSEIGHLKKFLGPMEWDIRNREPSQEEKRRINVYKEMLEEKGRSLFDLFNSFSASGGLLDKHAGSGFADYLQSSLGEMSQKSAKKVAAVFLIYGSQRTSAIVVSPEKISQIDKDLRDVDVYGMVSDFLNSLRSDRVDPRPAGKKLYDSLFSDIEGSLPDGTEVILWSMEGWFRYMPVAAIYDGKSYMAEKFQNVSITRTRFDTKADTPAKFSAVGFGTAEPHSIDGMYFSGLEGVTAELNSLFGGEDAPLNGKVIKNRAFHRNSFFKTIHEEKPSVVHISSHFSLKAGSDIDSFLVLGDGNKLTLEDMKLERNFLKGVDLLTLAACDTGVQVYDSNGLEIDGFAELAQRLGARSVMATLWPVADESTALWMSEFYSLQRENPEMSKAEAMQAAQIKMINGEIKGKSIKRCAPHSSPSAQFTSGDMFFLTDNDRVFYPCNQDAPYSHPYYWAPFILIGNWR